MKTQEALKLNEHWDVADLGDMYSMTVMYDALRHDKMQIDTEHMQDVLLMAIEYLQNVEKH